jgi:hypothetical protein
LAVGPLPLAAAPTVSAGSATVDIGDTFTIEISIADAQDLSAWQFDLAFDPLRLAAGLVAEGGCMSDSGATTLFSGGSIDNSAGLIAGVSNSYVYDPDYPPNPCVDGVLAEIEFRALSNGLTALTLSEVSVNWGALEIAVVAGAVCVGGNSPTDCSTGPSVPEPGTLALVAAAALCGGVARRRRRLGRGPAGLRCSAASR